MSTKQAIIGLSCPEEYQRALKAYCIVNNISTSQAIREMLYEKLSHIDPNLPQPTTKQGRPKKSGT